jgi:O-antigen/teichoic acid export membrane protein
MIQKENAQKKLAGNAVSGMVATIIYMVSRLLLTPFILKFLSLSEFGLWSLCFIILSYAGMGGFGVNSTYIRYSARYLAEGREKDISKLLSTGVAYMFSFCLLFCTILYLMMPFILKRFHIDSANQTLASTLFLGTAAVFSLELTLGGFRFIINGMHEFSKERIVTTVAGLIEVAAIMTLLWLGAGVKGLLYAFALRLVLETFACWRIARSMLPSLEVSWKLVNREHFRLFVGFGGKVQVLGIMAIFLAAVDRLFITAISGLAAGGLFEIGRKLPSTAGGISSSAFGPLLSTAAHVEGAWSDHRIPTFKDRAINYVFIALSAIALASIPIAFIAPVQQYLPVKNVVAAVAAAVAGLIFLFLLKRSIDTETRLTSLDLKQLYLNSIRFTNIINSILFVFLIAMAHPLINAWVGNKYPEAADVMVLLSTAYSIQLCTGPITLIFRGIDRNGRELEYMMIQMILMVFWIPAGTMVWGLKGSAGAIACSSAVSTLFLIWRSNKTFQIRFQQFVSVAILPALSTLLPAGMIIAITKMWPQTERFAEIFQVLACGTGYVLFSAALIWRFILDENEKARALELLPLKKRSVC